MNIETYYSRNKEKVKKSVERWRNANRKRVNETHSRYAKAHRYKRYKLTEDAFNKLHEEQDYSCAICRTPFSEGKRKCGCVDHNHETNKVRGLLCQHCNAGLGMFKDNILYLEKAIEYLRRDI